MDKQALLAYINRAIVILGSTKVRVDELGSVGVPITEAIQNLGQAAKIVNGEEEDKTNEQETSNEPG